jgi:hypothetical protein
MGNFGKAARLILAASAPVLAMAQAPQVRPSPQPRPAVAPSAGSTTGATAAPAAHSPRPDVAPNSQRFVTSENFFRAGTKPQPAVNAQPAGAQPNAQRPDVARYTSPVQTRPVLSQTTQPAVTAASPVLSTPQPPAAPPVLVTPSSAKNSGLAGSASVDYTKGQLTVVSQNASLGFVLKLVAAKTGAVVDLAPELQNEPVMAQLGPSSVREVLTALLDSPRIDYIIMGSANDSDGLQRLLVRTRRSFGHVAMAAVRRPQPQQQAEEVNLDENGNPASGPTPAGAKMSQEQLMESWKKTREEMRQAEIKQQAQDRENEKTQPHLEPQPEPQADPPQPENLA